MPPNLENMFNRGANLSTRRPLLPDHQPLQIVERCPRYVAVPVATYHSRPYPDTHEPCRFDTFHGPNYEDRTRIEFANGTPNNVRFEPYRSPRSAISYQKNKLHSPVDLHLDQRETELVFRFDTHSTDELNGNDYVHYTKGSPLNSTSNGSPKSNGSTAIGRKPPDKDGPFVFGVHSPSQFTLPVRPSRDDYESVDDKTVINEVQSNKVDCCERTKSKTKKCFNRIFRIRSRNERTVKKNKIKCVLVGDGAVGKSSLITAYAQNKFNSDYEPTAYDNFNVEVEVDNRPVCVEICDTAGQDSMSELRSLCFPGTDVLMLCFSVVRPETFRSVGSRWVRAVSSIKAPLLLVGTQADRVSDPDVIKELALRGEHVVTESEARQLASAINAQYIETSAKTRKNLKDAFDAAILAGLPVVKTKKPFWKRLLCWK